MARHRTSRRRANSVQNNVGHDDSQVSRHLEPPQARSTSPAMCRRGGRLHPAAGVELKLGGEAGASASSRGTPTSCRSQLPGRHHVLVRKCHLTLETGGGPEQLCQGIRDHDVWQRQARGRSATGGTIRARRAVTERELQLVDHPACTGTCAFLVHNARDVCQGDTHRR